MKSIYLINHLCGAFICVFGIYHFYHMQWCFLPKTYYSKQGIHGDSLPLLLCQIQWRPTIVHVCKQKYENVKKKIPRAKFNFVIVAGMKWLCCSLAVLMVQNAARGHLILATSTHKSCKVTSAHSLLTFTKPALKSRGKPRRWERNTCNF